MSDSRSPDQQPRKEDQREAAPEGAPDSEEDSSRPAQNAARHEPGGEEEHIPQDGTEDERFDTDQHSDAPGPFGTG